MQPPLGIVGLGNPGRKYEKTRHNVGFQVLDLVAGRREVGFTGGKGDYVVASARFGERQVLLAKPTTFMNLSGRAVQGLVAFYGLELNGLLVVVDDVNLPMGRLRMRPGGSAGGHKGLEDIIYQLGSEDFPRLRIGVGGENVPRDLRGYVLDRFARQERPVIEAALSDAALAAEVFVDEGIEAAMNRYNQEKSD